MNIIDFEKQTPPEIITRGKRYFKGGKIIKINVEDKAYFAKVDGTRIYNVTVRLDDNGKIIQSVCNCPYDMGNICKHEIAVYYAIREMINGIQNTSENNYENKSEIKPSIDNKKEKDEKIRRIIKDMPKQQLEFLLYKYARQVDIVEKDIIYITSSDTDKEKAAKELIREYLNRYKRRGYIDYRNASYSLEGARQVLENAENEKALTAVRLCIAVLSIALKIDNIDDSDGCLGEVIFDSLDIINRKTDSSLNDEEKKQLLTIILKESDKKYYENWAEFKAELLYSCIGLCDNTMLRYRFEEKLDKIHNKYKNNEYSGEYLSKEIKKIKYELVRRYDGEMEAKLYVNRNIGDDYFRKIAVENALSDEDYDYALKLIAKLYYSVQNTKEWLEYKLQAFKGKKDIKKTRETLIKLILLGRIDYYDEYKIICNDNWKDSLNHLLNEFEKDERSFIFNKVTYIEIINRENLQDKMLKLCQNDLSYIPELSLYLDEEHKIQIKEEFEKYIMSLSAQSHDRKKYRDVCRIIRRYKKVYGEEYKKIINRLKTLYPRRISFVSELSEIY